MGSSLRALLLWLVAFALPVQGIAAVTMLHCGAAMHPTMSMSMAAAPSAPHAQHDHAAHAQRPAPAGKATCNACAACCVGAALAALPALTSPPSARHAAPRLADEAALPDAIVALPERPPRALHA